MARQTLDVLTELMGFERIRLETVRQHRHWRFYFEKTLLVEYWPEDAAMSIIGDTSRQECNSALQAARFAKHLRGQILVQRQQDRPE
jgi:hypothetical protein